jgi:hypothetical protein
VLTLNRCADSFKHLFEPACCDCGENMSNMRSTRPTAGGSFVHMFEQPNRQGRRPRTGWSSRQQGDRAAHRVIEPVETTSVNSRLSAPGDRP